MHFLAHYISAHRGCCGLKILHALEIDQAFTAHTRSGTELPQKNSNRENFKFGLKFSVLIVNNFRCRGSILTKLFQSTCRKTGVIKRVQFWKARLQKFGRAKNRTKLDAIFDNFRLDREYLRNGSTDRKSEKIMIIYNP